MNNVNNECFVMKEIEIMMMKDDLQYCRQVKNKRKKILEDQKNRAQRGCYQEMLRVIYDNALTMCLSSIEPL